MRAGKFMPRECEYDRTLCVLAQGWTFDLSLPRDRVAPQCRSTLLRLSESINSKSSLKSVIPSTLLQHSNACFLWSWWPSQYFHLCRSRSEPSSLLSVEWFRMDHQKHTRSSQRQQVISFVQTCFTNVVALWQLGSPLVGLSEVWSVSLAEIFYFSRTLKL